MGGLIQRYRCFWTQNTVMGSVVGGPLRAGEPRPGCFPNFGPRPQQGPHGPRTKLTPFGTFQ